MRSKLTLMIVSAVLLASIALPLAAHEPTYGGLTAAEWVVIVELVDDRNEQNNPVQAVVEDPLPGWAFPLEVEHAVNNAAAKYGVSGVILAEIVRCESKGDPSARNRSSGAAGLGQHLPRYWPARAAAAGHPGASAFDPVANADTTAWLLRTEGTAPWAPWSGYCSTAY
jgi:soluble lytic murein transglycosylase-like protein